jgi:phosphatidylserine decarboxylase
VRIAREALPFAVIFGALACAVALWSLWAAMVPVALVLFTLYFFRDPERVAPTDSLAILSPADGRIIRASGSRVSVFLSIMDVHICRAPVEGRVQDVVSVPGKFLAAFKDAASEQNERTTIELETTRGRCDFTLVAGLVARRIVCKVSAGRRVAAGERVGLIRFGSRVDVDLPASARLAVRVGDRVVGGETVIARHDAAPGV